MNRSLNKVMLIGNLTRDPELRYTSKGTAVCNFGIATNRYWKSSDDGETKEKTEFHRIVAWQKLAEICAQLLAKGRKVFVEGRLQTRKWSGSDGQERKTTEVVIDNMVVLDFRSSDEGKGSSKEEEKKSSSSKEKEEKKEEKKKTEKEKEEKAVKKDKKEEVKADDIPF